jgi:hypothetical protein
MPLEDTSIALLGLSFVYNNYHTSVVQCLYAIAVLDGTRELPDRTKAMERIAFINAWCKRRYPGHGNLGHIVESEMIGYTDSLLEELGLESHGNREDWWHDLTDPCLASDYTGLLDEYRGSIA